MMSINVHSSSLRIASAALATPGRTTWLAFLIVASSLISVVHIGRIVEVVWFRPLSATAKRAEEPPLSMLLPTLLLVAATIYFGIDTSATAGIAGRAAEWLLAGVR